MLESTIQARLIGNYTASNWEEARCLWQCLEMGKFCTKKTSLLRHLPLLKSQDPETTVLFLIWSSISYPLIHHSVISLVLSEVFCNYTIKFKITIVAQKRCHPQKKNTSSPFFCVYSLYWSFFSDVLNIAIWCSKIYTTSRSDTLQKVAFAFSSVVTFATTWVRLVGGWVVYFWDSQLPTFSHQPIIGPKVRESEDFRSLDTQVQRSDENSFKGNRLFFSDILPISICSFCLLKDCKKVDISRKKMVGFVGFVGQADETSSEDVRVKAGTCSTPFSTVETSRIRTRGNFPGDSNQPGGRCIGKLWFKEGHQVYRLYICNIYMYIYI